MYKTINIPSKVKCEYTWWVPEEVIKVIKWIEKQNAGYSFVQFVTSPGNGGYPDFVILKKKEV